MKNAYQLELEIKEQVLMELLDDVMPKVNNVEIKVYEEIDRIISGRISREKVSYKIRKCYENELNKIAESKDDNYRAIVLKAWLENIQDEIEPILKVGQLEK